jgi:hypothetical protein
MEGRGAFVFQDDVLVAFGADGDSVVPAIREYLADEPICKELAFATSGATWAMLLEATEERDKDGVAELCDALSEFVLGDVALGEWTHGKRWRATEGDCCG